MSEKLEQQLIIPTLTITCLLCKRQLVFTIIDPTHKDLLVVCEDCWRKN